MRHDEFVAAVEAALGPRLQHATVQNVRELIAWFDRQSGDHPREDGRLVLVGDPDATAESTALAFLADCLRADPEAARQHLWMALLDVWYGLIEVEAAESFDPLFEDLPPE